MSAMKLSWVLSQVTVTVLRQARTVSPLAPVLRHHIRQYQRLFSHGLLEPISANPLSNTSSFSTQASDGGDDEQQSEESVKKTKVKQDPKARKTVSNVGRKIHHRRLLLLSETGENLGTFHRADVIRMMEEKQLRLVAVNENADPPVFRLMTGKQIHEEQMKLREKTKSKTGPVQVKELSLSSDIGRGDLKTKLRQISPWLEKKHHIRITLKAKGYRDDEASPSLDKSLEAMLSTLDVQYSFQSPPRVIREGRAAACIIRPPSEKEKRASMTNSTPPDSSAPSKEIPQSTSAASEGSADKEVEQK